MLQWAQMVYYAAFAVVFQFGWASVQISHLALIPSLSHNQNERTGLTALRLVLSWRVHISHLALIPSLSHHQNQRTGLTALRWAYL